MAWTQVYDPLHNWIFSTLVASLPILVLFGLLAGLRVKPHWCAIAAAGTAVVLAVSVFGMPVSLAGMSFLYGVGFGVLKIAWIVLAAVYLYDVSVHTGQFEIMKESVAGITADRRLQLLMVAFCFGAFIEGAAGFGAPVAIAGAFMIGLGFKPFHAAALNLLANTSPVAWGAIGTPVHTLAAVSGLPESDLSDDRPHPPHHRDHRSVLAGPGDGELERDLRGAACHSGGGDFVQRDAVPLVQPRGLEPRRHRGRGRLPRCHGGLPAVLAAEAHLEVRR